MMAAVSQGWEVSWLSINKPLSSEDSEGDRSVRRDEGLRDF